MPGNGTGFFRNIPRVPRNIQLLAGNRKIIPKCYQSNVSVQFRDIFGGT